MLNKNRTVLIAVVFALAGLATGCGDENQKIAQGNSSAPSNSNSAAPKTPIGRNGMPVAAPGGAADSKPASSVPANYPNRR